MKRPQKKTMNLELKDIAGVHYAEINAYNQACDDWEKWLKATELLEACKEARKLYDELSMSNLELACKYGDEYKPMGKEDCLEMREALEQAIAKAEGGSK